MLFFKKKLNLNKKGFILVLKFKVDAKKFDLKQKIYNFMTYKFLIN